ncbi:MAG: hypothetical protein A2252_02015 [Elusimicrobia bacterium RIFOXYA2_FULL_39_19]|nr:MAG: hypothetical protein A2252_02015 [Elusimicrobia bacterium RIFOXYA2_FULL_39_19]
MYCVKKFLDRIREHKEIMHRHFTSRLDDDVVKFGLSPSHFAVMNYLLNGKTTLMSEAARELKITLPTMTNIIDHLEEKKLIARIRQEDDRRAIKISLTKKGKELLDDICGDWENQFGKFVNSLKAGDKKKLMNSINTLIDIVKSHHCKCK